MSDPAPLGHAVAQLFGSPRWRHEPRIWHHVACAGEHAEEVDWDAVLAETWSGGERTFLEALASLSDPRRRVSFAEVVIRLDDDNFWQLMATVRELRQELR